MKWNFSDEEIKFIKDFFDIDFDDQSDEVQFEKIKGYIIYFYMERFGLNVNDKINSICFNSIVTSKFWESFFNDLNEKISKHNQEKEIFIRNLSFELTGSVGNISIDSLEVFNSFFNSNDFGNVAIVGNLLYYSKLLTSDEINQFDIASDEGLKQLADYIRGKYREGKYRKVDDCYLKYKQFLSDYKLEDKKYKLLKKIFDARQIHVDKLNSNFINLNDKSQSEIDKKDYDRVVSLLSSIIGESKTKSFLGEIFLGDINGLFDVINNISGTFTNVVCYQKLDYNMLKNDLIAIHELNHGIESRVLYEDDEYYITISGWHISPSKKNKDSKSFNEKFSKLSDEEKKSIIDFFNLDGEDIKSCTYSDIDIDSALFLIKNANKLLPLEYSKLALNKAVPSFNEAINDYITYKIYEHSTGRKEYISNTGYVYLFPLIEKFYELYEEDIIMSRHNGNISIILDKVGTSNFIRLANLVDEYRYCSPKDRKLRKDEFIKKSDEILQLIMDYSNKSQLKK